MGKIGILGGTFNPIHNGHISLALAARTELGLDKVIIIPTGFSYMKSDIEMPSKEIRYTMVSLACEDIEYLEASDIEVKRDGYTYTYETLYELKKINPDNELYFIIGADTLYSIEMWKEPQKIFDKAIIAAAVRDDINLSEIENKCNELKEKYKATVIPLNAPKVDISSSQIREMIANGNNVCNLIPQKVYDFIKKNKLY